LANLVSPVRNSRLVELEYCPDAELAVGGERIAHAYNEQNLEFNSRREEASAGWPRSASSGRRSKTAKARCRVSRGNDAVSLEGGRIRRPELADLTRVTRARPNASEGGGIHQIRSVEGSPSGARHIRDLSIQLFSSRNTAGPSSKRQKPVSEKLGRGILNGPGCLAIEAGRCAHSGRDCQVSSRRKTTTTRLAQEQSLARALGAGSRMRWVQPQGHRVRLAAARRASNADLRLALQRTKETGIPED